MARRRGNCAKMTLEVAPLVSGRGRPRWKLVCALSSIDLQSATQVTLSS
jgi:hypothetical protein